MAAASVTIPITNNKRASNCLQRIGPDLWLLVKSRCWYLVAGFALMIVSRIAALVLPFSSKFLVDDVIGKNRGDLLLPLVAIVIGGVTAQALAEWALTRILSIEAHDLIAELRRKVQAHVLRLPVAYYDKNKSGALVARIMSDVEGLRNLLGTSLIQFAGSILTAILALCLLTRINLVMTLIVVISLAIYSAHLQMRLGKMRPLFRNRSSINAEVTGRLTEALGAARVVKGYHAESREEQVFAGGVQRLLQNALKSVGLSTVTNLSSAIFFGAMSAFIMYWGSRQVLNDSMTLGSFITYTMLLGQLTGPLMQLTGLGTQLNAAIAGFERTREVPNERLEAQGP